MIPVAGDSLEPLRGEWEMVLAVRDGQPLGADFVSSGRQVLAGNVTTVYFRGQVFMQGTTSVDATRVPMTIDYRLTRAPGRGRWQFGIYEFAGGTLRICVAPPEQPRPDDFSTHEGDDRTLMVWRRRAA